MTWIKSYPQFTEKNQTNYPRINKIWRGKWNHQHEVDEAVVSWDVTLWIKQWNMQPLHWKPAWCANVAVGCDIFSGKTWIKEIWKDLILRVQDPESKGLYGPRQANLVLIAYASSEGSGEPAHPRSLARTSAVRSYKQWVKRNLQTESQITGPSEWLGMRS